jgi:hypothetical protein
VGGAAKLPKARGKTIINTRSDRERAQGDGDPRRGGSDASASDRLKLSREIAYRIENGHPDLCAVDRNRHSLASRIWETVKPPSRRLDVSIHT